MEITEFSTSGFTAVGSLHLWRMPEMDAPRALVFRPQVKGNEALGTRSQKFKNAVVMSHFRFVLEENSRKEIT